MLVLQVCTTMLSESYILFLPVEILLNFILELS
jgi:hypothetical protein